MKNPFRARTAFGLFWRIGLATVLVVGLAYGGILGWYWSHQRELMYPAETARTAPAAAGLADFAEVIIPTADGERLVAWWRPPAPGAGVVIYFHGNSGALPDRAVRFRDMARAGLGVLAVAYRGYGGSSGTPSEQGLLEDARAAYGWAAMRAPAARSALLGESLGTGVAVALATERPVAGVVLDSPYASAERTARLWYPWLPVRGLMTDRFDSEARVTRMRAPLLVVHCSNDRMIPIAEGRRLYERAPVEKRFIAVGACGHIETWRDADARARMLEALTSFTGGRPWPAGLTSKGSTPTSASG